VRTALLRGREHLELGAIDLISEGRVAIALSLGGARKAYAHTDPNEDAVAFAQGRAGTLLAVADGHRGFEASEVTLEYLLETPAPHWAEFGAVSPESWARQVLAALCDANAEIRRERSPSDEGRSRTTLALALVLPEHDAVLYASVGDSHVFLVGRDEAVDLASRGEQRPYFLGHGDETPESLGEKCNVGVAPLGDALAVVLASDGLSERNIGVADAPAAAHAATVSEAEAPRELRPARIARALCEIALEAHRANPSGDNIAAAVVTLPDRDSA